MFYWFLLILSMIIIVIKLFYLKAINNYIFLTDYKSQTNVASEHLSDCKIIKDKDILKTQISQKSSPKLYSSV